MFKYKTRVLMEFDYLNKQTAFTTSRELAQVFHVSEKTVKNDIAELSQLCAESGARLYSKRHYGYRVEVVDPVVYESVANTLFIYFYGGIHSSLQKDERLLSILQAIIMSEEYLTIDALAERFYVTRSSIISKLKIIKTVIASYHIHIKKPYEEGAMLSGSEYDLRLLMLDSIENPHYLNSIYFLKEMYQRWFQLDSEEERLMLRQQLLHTLRAHRYRLRDDTINKAAYYLCLLKKRSFAAHPVTFSKQEANMIRSFGLYTVIKEMMITITERMSYTCEENEVLALCLYLMSHIDGNSNADLFPKRTLLKAGKLAKDILLEIDRCYGLDFTSLEGAYARLLHTLAPIIIQSEFHTASHKNLFSQPQEQMNPLAAELSRLAAMVYTRHWGDELSEDNRLLLTALFSALLLEESYPFRLLNIAVTGPYGLNHSEITKQIFLSRFSRYIKSIDVYELFELRAYPKERFDVVIASFGTLQQGYRYEWPLFSFDNLPSDQKLNSFFNDFIISQLDLQGWIQRFAFPDITFYNDCRHDGEEDFIEMISFKYGHEDKAAQSIRTYLQEVSPIRFERGGGAVFSCRSG